MSETASIAARMRAAWCGPSWHGPVMREILEGITAGQASIRTLPNTHTIWELVNHISAWREAALRGVSDGVAQVAEAENFAGPVDGSAADWIRTLDRFRASEQRLLACVAALQDDGLGRVVRGGGDSYTLAVLLNGVVDHDLYHSGQIMLLRKAGGETAPTPSA